MWVKICANTCAEDALAAAELGADAVGFVFAPSQRRITPSEARAIAHVLPPEVERVGVFAGGSVEAIAESAREARLHAVQWHGRLDLAFAQRLADRLGPEVSLILTLHWTAVEEQSPKQAQQAKVSARIAQVKAADREYRVLIDARVGSASGGLGVRFDWQAARAILNRDSAPRLIVAGGLDPENVAEAIRVLQPWGVDVASGVERVPGRKDYGKLQAFIHNARQASPATRDQPEPGRP